MNTSDRMTKRSGSVSVPKPKVREKDVNLPSGEPKAPEFSVSEFIARLASDAFNDAALVMWEAFAEEAEFVSYKHKSDADRLANAINVICKQIGIARVLPAPVKLGEVFIQFVKYDSV